MLKKIAAVLSVLVLSAGVVFADDTHHHGKDHAHDHGQDGHDHDAKHGGIVVHSGHHHLELVASGNTLVLHVTNEDGGAEDVASAKASATVLAEGKAETIMLAPDGASSLKGTGGFKAGKGTTVVVNLTLPGHATEQARFRLD